MIEVIALAEAGCMILGYYVQDAAGIASFLSVFVFFGLIVRSFFNAEPNTKALRYVGGLAVWFAWNLLTGLCFRVWVADGFPADFPFKITGCHVVPAIIFLLTMIISFCRGFVALLLCQWGVAACYGLALVLPVCSYVLACVMNSKLWDALVGI